MKISAHWTFLLLTTVQSPAAERILVDDYSSKLAFKQIALSGAPFEQTRILDRARRYLASNQGKRLAVLTLSPDEPGARLTGNGCDHCAPYQFWREQYDSVAKLRFPIAELVYMEGNAVLRFRHLDGHVTETILQGKNPLEFSIGDFRGKIAHIAMSGRVNENPTVKLYVVGSGQIDAVTAERRLVSFNDRNGFEWTDLYVRSDPWFMGEIWSTWFPLLQERRGTPPTAAQFKASKQLECYRMNRPRVEISCSWNGLATLP